jgi:hypothetical protein
MQRHVRLLLLLNILFFAGCIPRPSLKKQYTALENAPICCDSMSQFHYKPIASATEEFLIGAGSQSFKFEHGKSFLAAFELPKGGPRLYRLESYFNGSFVGQYFEPVLIFLDAKYQSLTTGRMDLSFLDKHDSKSGTSHMHGEFSIPENAKFLVVFTSEFQDIPPIAKVKPIDFGYSIGTTPLVLTSSSKGIQLERSPVGSFRITPWAAPKREIK